MLPLQLAVLRADRSFARLQEIKNADEGEGTKVPGVEPAR
jgi:hypothetical protein